MFPTLAECTASALSPERFNVRDNTSNTGYHKSTMLDVFLVATTVFVVGGAVAWWLKRPEPRKPKPLPDWDSTDNRYRDGVLREGALLLDEALKETDFDKRNELLRHALERFEAVGDSLQVAKVKAFLAEEAGDFVTAAAQTEVMLRIMEPSYPEPVRGVLLFSKASYLRRCGWYRSATEAAIQAVQFGAAKETGAMVVHQAAQLLAGGNRFDDAEEYAILAGQISRTDEERAATQDTVALLRHYAGRLTESLRIYETIAKERPTSNAFFLAALLCEEVGRFADAEARMHEAMRLVERDHPTAVEALRALYYTGFALIYKQQGLYTEALAQIAAAEPVFFNEPRMALNCRVQRVGIAAAGKTELTTSTHADADIVQAALYAETQTIPRRADALRFWSDEWYDLATTWYDLGEPERALAILKPFAATNCLLPVQEPRYHYLSGQCYEAQGDTDTAIADYRRVLSCRCELVERHFALAQARLNVLTVGSTVTKP